MALDRKRLDADRLRRLLTWEQYATHLGISRSTLFNILAGKRVQPLTEAKILAVLERRTS